MMDQVARSALLHQFAVILDAHGDARADAGLAVLRAMREAGARCWVDLLPDIAKWAVPLYGFQSRPRPDGVNPYGFVDALDPREAVVELAARLDLVPPADMAELALLVEVYSIPSSRDRTYALHARWSSARDGDSRERLEAEAAPPEWLSRLMRKVR